MYFVGSRLLSLRLRASLRRAARATGLGCLIAISACSSLDKKKRPLDLPFEKVFLGTYDTVWNATVRVLDIYSITVASRDAGLLQTEWADYRYNRELYDHPDRAEHLEEVRYRLKIKLSKGIVNQTGKPAVRVQISKELEEYKNFFTDWRQVPTDEFEEKVILYRIGHRLKIAEVLRRKSTGSKAGLEGAPGGVDTPDTAIQ